MAGTQGEPVKGIQDLNSGLSNFRTFGIDKASVTRRVAGELPFATLLMMKTRKKFVDTYAFDHVEQPEKTTYLTLNGAGADVDGNFTKFDVPNAEGDLLQKGQLVHNMSILWSESSGYSKPASIPLNYNPEMGEVVDLSKGATYTTVTIKRNHAIKGSGSSANSSTTLWASTDRVARGTFARFDTEGTGKPVYVNPFIYRSYVQDIFGAFGLSERQLEEKRWVYGDPLADARDAELYNLMYDIDRLLTVHGKGMEVSSGGGYNRTFSHSMVSVLSTVQSTNWKKITGKNPAALDAAFANMSEVGHKGDVRIVASSGNFIRIVKDMFQSFIKDEPLAGSKNAGFTVPTYTDAVGCKYQFMYSRSVTDSYGSGTDAGAIGINMDNVDLAIFKGQSGKSYDLHTDMGKTGKGRQSNNSNSILGEHRLIAGLMPKNYKYHAFFYF